jgi:hypothetical protein
VSQKHVQLALLLSATGLLAACSSSQKVLMPPRVDLVDHGTVGMLRFASVQNEDLGTRASEEFLAAMQSAQPGVPVLELGAESVVLSSVGGETLDPQTIRRIGEEYEIDVLLVGVLETSAVKPGFSVGTSIESMSAKAEIEAALTTRMYDTGSGATMWTRTARAKETVAQLDLSGQGLGGGGAHPDDARARLVRHLVSENTQDLRPYWVRQ